MDWDGVIEKNREALKRIVASLAALAGLAGFTSPLVGFEAGLRRRREVVVPVARQQAEKAGTLPEAAGTRQEDGPARRGDLSAEAQRAKAEAEALAEPGEGCSSNRPTLPRHLHRAVLRLLRPAEAAARRLVIVAALRALGIAVVMSPADHARAAAKSRRPEARSEAEPRRAVLPLFDPPQYPFRVRLRTVAPHCAPRILSFDGATPHRLPPPPAPDDPIDAGRLALRVQALASALDDLPEHARRFARWRARRNTAGAVGYTGRVRRIWPLRRGRPPGLSAANRRRPAHEVHEVLGDLQYFALRALEQPDTS